MAFDNKYYSDIKKLTDWRVSHVDFRLAEKYKNKPFEWAITFLPMISNCIESEDYEGAKAMTDSIREFLNRFLPDGEKIPLNVEFKLPKYKQVNIKGIICFVGGNYKIVNK